MPDSLKIVVLNGPNLNRLGKRQPEVYGRVGLVDVEKQVKARAAELGAEVDFKQTNHEGEMIEWVHQAADDGAAVIINPVRRAAPLTCASSRLG